MPDMKSTSASVYGSRPSPGGVAWRPRAGAPAHAAAAAATIRNTTIVWRDSLLIRSVRQIVTQIHPEKSKCLRAIPTTTSALALLVRHAWSAEPHIRIGLIDTG